MSELDLYIAIEPIFYLIPIMNKHSVSRFNIEYTSKTSRSLTLSLTDCCSPELDWATPKSRSRNPRPRSKTNICPSTSRIALGLRAMRSWLAWGDIERSHTEDSVGAQESQARRGKFLENTAAQTQAQEYSRELGLGSRRLITRPMLVVGSHLAAGAPAWRAATFCWVD